MRILFFLFFIITILLINNKCQVNAYKATNNNELNQSSLKSIEVFFSKYNSLSLSSSSNKSLEKTSGLGTNLNTTTVVNVNKYFINNLLDNLIKLFQSNEYKQEHEQDDENTGGHYNIVNHKHEDTKNDTRFKCLIEKINKLKHVLSSSSLVDDSINADSFTKLSTILVVGMDECVNPITSNQSDKQDDLIKYKRERWIFALVSALFISIMGILCYMIVPSINAVCFNYLFQFLVALAVGSLSGDALLHLIPHAFSSGHNHSDLANPSEDESSHNAGVYKGLGALVGIYVFYLIEKVMQMRRARKEKRHKKTEMINSEHENEDDKFIQSNHQILNSNNKNELVVIDTAPTTGALTFNLDSRPSTGLNLNANRVYANEHDQHQHQHHQQQYLVGISNSSTANTKSTPQFQIDNNNTIEDLSQSCLVIHANKDLKYISQYLPNNKCTENVDHHDHENEIEHLHQHSLHQHNKGQSSNTTSIPSAKNTTNNNNNNKLIISSTNNSTNITNNNNNLLNTTTNTTTNNNLLFNNNNNPISTNNTNNNDCSHKTCNNSIVINNNKDVAQNKIIDDQSALLITNSSCLCTTSASLQSDNQDLDNSITNRASSHVGVNNHLLITPTNDKFSKSHGHSHSHKYKSSREKAHHDHHKKHEKEISDIKLIAWMVLMGDGLHNFADGLAIGASFASSLSTGFGTAIAVLCHELPHEIGDFAVLRRAGVSFRRALVFNAVSGILCIVGVFVGLLIGGYETLSSWAFLFIAGTFLYISLVDMIPELSEDKEDDSIQNFFIQSMGILAGVGIMLTIALLEDKIKSIFK